MKLRIFVEDDRLKVAAILVKNGYQVSQSKGQRPGSKSYDYFLDIEDLRPLPDSGKKAVEKDES